MQHIIRGGLLVLTRMFHEFRRERQKSAVAARQTMI